MTDWGEIAASRLADIAKASAPGPGVTRLPFTAEHRHALDLIGAWMREAGLAVRLDAAGTLAGRLPGPDGSPTFYMGSHQDSVRYGGAFDGIMGIALPILALEKLSREGTTLPFSVECLAFADEEGVRFPTALMGPRALAGTFDPNLLEVRDKEQISLRDAMRNFGLQPDDMSALRRPADQALGYLETHIEQGPVLESAGQGLGVVSAICGIERHRIVVGGATGHAGTVPMAERRDALVGAAQIVAAVDRLARSKADLRATVGAIDVHPNVVNAIPGRAELTTELRSPDDGVRTRAGEHLQQLCADLALRTGLRIEVERTYAQSAQACDPSLSAVLAEAVLEAGGNGVMLPSGATHDASAMADLCPIAMLFVRCRGGVSHTPEEFASAEDMGLAITALGWFLKALGARVAAAPA